MIGLALLLAGLLQVDTPSVRVETRLPDASPAAATAVVFEVTATAPQDVAIVPDWPAALGSFEILGVNAQPSVVRDGQRVVTWDLQLMTFASGALTIPPVDVVAETGRDRVRRVVSSQPVAVTVRPGVAITPTDQLRVPLRSLTLPWTLLDAALAVTIIALLTLVWRHVLSTHQGRSSFGASPLQPAQDAPPAGRRWPTVAELEAALPRTPEGVPPFYDLAVEVTRGAITGATGLPADRMSSRELIAALRDVPGRAPDEVARLLDSIDRVRFGRHMPPLAEPARILAAVKQLTRRQHARSSGGAR